MRRDSIGQPEVMNGTAFNDKEAHMKLSNKAVLMMVECTLERTSDDDDFLFGFT